MITYRKVMVPTLLKFMFPFVVMVSLVHGGGMACRFKPDGLALLKDSAHLVDVLSESFEIQNDGVMGPKDAPFRGGRLYSYMEFKAWKKGEKQEKFIVRLHFTREEKKWKFKSLEMIASDHVS